MKVKDGTAKLFDLYKVTKFLNFKPQLFDMRSYLIEHVHDLLVVALQ